MAISASSLAAGTSVKVRNEPLTTGAQFLSHKIAIFAPAQDDYSGVLNTPILVTSAEDAAAKFGAGTAAHRLTIAAFAGHGYSVPTYIIMEANPEGAVAASVEYDLSVASGHAAGIISLYVAGELMEIIVNKNDSDADIIARAKAKADATPNLPGIMSLIEGQPTQFRFTAKDKGVYGNGITVEINQHPELDEALPAGISFTRFNNVAGAGVPAFAADIAAALGTGDSANEEHFTEVVTAYGDNTTVLDALSEYVGEGQNDTGLYADMVGRPFRSLYGNVALGSDGLLALIAFTNNRVNDRCNGVICRPGSLSHPAEIAAEAIGYMAQVNNVSPELTYVGHVLSGVDASNLARKAGLDWTTDYANRDMAVKAGISPTIVQGGSVLCQNIVSHWRPASIPQASNAYREMANISKIQNILYNTRILFESVKWQAFTVVGDVSAVVNAEARSHARDVSMVKDDLLALATQFLQLAWIYSLDLTIEALRGDTAVQVRPGGDGFTTHVPYVLSGVGNIKENTVVLDTRIPGAV